MTSKSKVIGKRGWRAEDEQPTEPLAQQSSVNGRGFSAPGPVLGHFSLAENGNSTTSDPGT